MPSRGNGDAVHALTAEDIIDTGVAAAGMDRRDGILTLRGAQAHLASTDAEWSWNPCKTCEWGVRSVQDFVADPKHQLELVCFQGCVQCNQGVISRKMIAQTISFCRQRLWKRSPAPLCLMTRSQNATSVFRLPSTRSFGSLRTRCHPLRSASRSAAPATSFTFPQRPCRHRIPSVHTASLQQRSYLR